MTTVSRTNHSVPRGSLKARRRRELLLARYKFIAVIAIIALSLIILLGSSIHAFASSTDDKPYNKYYTSITVEKGDTLWTLADRLISGSDADKNDLIDEICQLNNLTDGEIHSGQNLMVCYYSQDLK